MAKACVVANLFRKGSSCSGASSFSTRTPAANVPAADASMRACTSEDSLECVALAEVQDGAQFLLRCQLVGESLVPFLRLECPQVRKVLEVRLSLLFFTETFAFLQGSRQVYFCRLKVACKPALFSGVKNRFDSPSPLAEEARVFRRAT